MNKTLKINFEASAKGLDQIFQDITKISKGLDLSKKTKESIAELEVQLPAFMKRVQSAMDNQNFSLIDLKELDKEFKGLSKLIENAISGIRTSNLSTELSKEVGAAIKKLKAAEDALQQSRSTVRGLQNKKSSKTSSGIAKTEENRVFSEKTGGKGVEIGDTVVAGYQDFVRVLGEARAAGKLTEEQNARLTKTEQELAKAMADRKAEIIKSIDEEKQKQASLKANVAAEQANVDALRNKTSTSNELTEQEKQIVLGLIDAQTRLGNARMQQARTVDQATKEEKELIEAQEASKRTTASAATEIDKNTKSLHTNATTISKAAKQVFTYGTVMSAFRKIYQTTIRTIKDMDKALTDMAVVTSMSRQDAYQLTGQFRDLAAQTGKTTTEIANMATKFYQQGKSTSQVMQLTEAAAKAATIAGIDGSKSIDLLTNAMNGFQIEASKAMEVSDKFAALAASAATDYEELATALSKVAAQANLAGMSMDFTLGLLTKGIETTREAPETIGTALKTVISRMRELTDYGATLEDGTDVNRVDKALQNVGISLMDANGQFRDLDSVLTELGHKWDTLTINQQANVAVALAGTRQQSRLIAMMQDFDRTLELVDISANSYGATMAQSADYMEGLEAATTRLTTAYEGLIQSITNSEFIIGMVDALTTMVSALEWIVGQWYIMIPLLIAGVMYFSYIGLLKLKEVEYQRELNKLNLKNEKLKKQQRLEAIRIRKEELKTHKVKTKVTDETREEYKLSLKDAALAARNNNNLALAALYESQIAGMIDDEVAQEKERALIAGELAALDAEETLLTAQIQQMDAQIAATEGMRAGLMNKLIGGASTFLSILSFVPTVLSLIVALRKKEGKEIDKNTAKEGKGIAAALAKAAANMAQSVAAIPVWGWVVAAAILAAAAIGGAIAAAAISANGKGSEKQIDKTRDKLNELQADLYNLQQAQANVGKLGDEFENLSSKIIKTSEDLERMNEIARQINDEAGRNVVDTTLSYEDQLNQIRGYEIQLEREAANKRKEINETLGEGLTNAQTSWTKKGKKRQAANYMDTLQTDPAFVNSIRAVAVGEIQGMNEVSAEARDAVLDLLVDNIKEKGIFGTDGVDTDAFEAMIGQDYNGGFNSFITDLDDTMTSGKLTDYAQMFTKMDDSLQNTIAASMPMFKAIKTMGVDTAKAFDEIGYSAEDLNRIWKQTEKNVKALGGDEQAVADRFATLARDLASTDGSKRQAAYQSLVEDTLAASQAAKEVLAMDDAQLAAAAASGNATAQAYQDAKNKQADAKTNLDEAEAALREAEEKGDDDAIADAQKAYDAASQAYAEAEAQVNSFADAANNANTTILDLQKLLGTKSTSEIVENLTKMGSAMERLGKITDLTTLSIKEQMELLSDYPELFNAMQRGFLTAGDALKLMDETFKEAQEQTAQGMSDLELIYRSGTGTIVSSTEWDAQYRDMFTSSGADIRAKLIDENLNENSDFVQMLQRLNPELSIYDALEAARQVQDSAKQYNQYGFLQNKYDTEGYTALMSEADKEAWANANSSSAKTRSMLEEFNTKLEYMDPNSDEYRALSKQRDSALDQAVSHGNARLAQIDSIRDEILTDAKGKGLTDYITYVNGVAYVNADKLAQLDAETQEDVKKSLSLVINSLNTYGEEYQDINEQLIEDNEARAQSFIDAESKVLEAQIDALEKRKEAYEKYFDAVDAMEEEQDRASTMEDITKQLAALTGGSGAATNEKRKELLAEMEELKQEEESARREAAREALINDIESQVETMNTKLDGVNDSLNMIVQLLANGELTVGKDADGNRVLLNSDGSVYKFASGGLVNYTGPAWVDGTPSNPEAFLSAADTKNMRLLLDTMQYVLNNNSTIYQRDLNANTGYAVHIDSINIKTEQLNNDQDFKNSGQVFAEEFAKAIRERGININVKR